MPQRVNVPGQGIVEFPDGMTSDAISSAIQNNYPHLKPTADAGGAPPVAAPIPPTQEPGGPLKLTIRPMQPGQAPDASVGGFASKALQPLTTYPETEARIAKESAQTVGQGLSDLRPQVAGGPKGKTASGLWDVATGAMRYAGAPIEAGLETVVGKPLEENFGLPAEYSKFAAGLAIPYYGLKGGPVVKTAKEAFAPETVSPMAGDAAGLIRGEQGKAARTTATSLQEIDKYHPIVNALPEPQRLDFFKYMEGRSGGATVDPKLQPIADTLRRGFLQRQNELSTLDRTAEMNFVTDYFPHMWKDPKLAQDFLAQYGGKEGSGRNIKARSIPTIEDGLAAGLELKSTNPLETYQSYLTNMDRFIATERVFEKAKDVGTIKYFPPGKQPAGWTEVKSRLGGDKLTGLAYAPDDWARIYNNFTSRGYMANPTAGSIYTAARMASNAVTGLELSLSGYHALTMAQEGMVNEVARSIQQGARGDLLKSAMTLSTAITAPIKLAMKGSKAQKIYLGTTKPTAEQAEVMDILTEAGGRFIGRSHAKDIGSSQLGSFFDAFKKGSLKTELLSDVKDIQGRPMMGTAKAVAKNIGRAMDTVMHPLFQTYIPKIKAGAAYENMADWLKANPAATREQQLDMARKIVDSIDNRFGEMIQDNIFWNQMLKQSAIVAMRSYSWNLGTVREIAGGATDVLGGKGLTQRAAYNIALPIVYGVVGGIYQRFKTGQGPQDIQDYIAPRTGGVDARTQKPERITPPGYMKDVFGWAADPRQEAINKLATAPRLAGEALFTGKDWRGDPIAPPGLKDQSVPANVPMWLKAYFKHVLEAMGPISIKNAMQGPKRGSNLSAFERVLGLQPSGMSKTDPQGFERMMRGIEEKRWRTKLRHDKSQENQYGGPVGE